MALAEKSRERIRGGDNCPLQRPDMTFAPAFRHLSIALLSTLSLASVGGCDLLDVPEEDTSADTDEDEDDANAGTDGDDESESGEDDGLTPNDEGSGDSSGDAPNPDPSPDAEPFDDDPAAALGALAGMGYTCFDAEDTRYNLLFDTDDVVLRFEDGSTTAGTYEASAEALTVAFPELGFTEGATDAAVALDALVYFETPSLQCGAFVLDHTVPEGVEVVTCPTIKYIPGTSWENNEFQFGNGGYVLRRSWTELPMIPDTLYSEKAGVYVTVGNRVYIVLPFEDESEQWLTGTVTDQGIVIDQLEPEQGACQ